MASAPPMFNGGDGPQVSRLPTPQGTSGPVSEGLNALSTSVDRAVEGQRSTQLQVDRLNYERNTQLATGETAARIADMQGQLSVDLIGMREHADPLTYDQQVDERIGKFRDDATALLGNNPELQARFVDNIAAIGANTRVEEAKWAAGQRAAKSVLDGDALQNSLQSNIRTAVAGGKFNDQMLADADKLDRSYIDAQPLPPDKKAELLSERHDARLVTVIDARTNVDPNGVLNDIDAGKYGELDDKVVNVLRSKAEVAKDKLDTRAKEAAKEQAGQQRAHAQNEIEDVNAGVIKDPTVLATYRAAFAASTDPADIKLVHDLDTAIAKNFTTAKYDDAAPTDRRAAMAAIETHKGWENDQKLVAAHTQLQALLNRDDQAADKDPLSLYQRQTGADIGHLDLHDPAAMRARFLAADRAAARYGKASSMLFTAPEADELKQQYNQATTSGKADFILGLGAYGSTRARRMMFQIAPTKPELVRLAELSAAPDPAVKAIVREAADGSAVPMKEGVSQAVRNIALRDYGPALQRMPGDRQAAVLQVATWVYAHRAAAAGTAAVLTPDLAHDAIEAALGGAGGKGGLGNRNGAPVVLPMGATQDDFDRVLAMGAAHGFRQSANGHPVWNTGKPMEDKDLLDMVPVLVQDDGTMAAYAFRSRGGSGFVKTDKGADYLLDIHSLSAHLKSTMGFNRQLADHGYVRR